MNVIHKMPRKNTSGVALGVLGMLLLLVVVIGAGRIGMRENMTAAQAAGAASWNSARIAKLQQDLVDLAKSGLNPSNNEAARRVDAELKQLLATAASAPVVVAAPVASGSNSARIAKLQQDLVDLAKSGLNPSNNEAARRVDAELKQLLATAAPAPAPVVVVAPPVVSASNNPRIAKLQQDLVDLAKSGLNPSNNEAARRVDAELKQLLAAAAPAPVVVMSPPVAPTPAPVPVVVAPPMSPPVPVVVAPPTPAPVPVVVAPPMPTPVVPTPTPLPTGTPAPAGGLSLKPASSTGTGNASTNAATDEDDEGFLGGIYSYFFPESEAQKAKKAVEEAKEEERLAKLTPAQRKLEGEYSITRLYRTIFPLNEQQQAKEDAEAAKEEARRAKLTPEERKDEDKKKLDTTSIVLISVGVIVVLAIVGMFVFNKSSSKPSQGGRRR